MLTNGVKRKLKAGKPVVGVWLALGDAIVAESLVAQGWDWLTVDTEHNPIDLLTMTGMFQALGRYPVAPLARIPEVSTNDLCNSMGLSPPLDPPHQHYEEAIQAILRSAGKHGVAPDVHTPTPEAVNRRLAEGWLMVRLHQQSLSPDGGRPGRARGDRERVDPSGAMNSV
jgi:2-keto-3-deoxy-L-rhamnonate aldolase RhmA